MASTRSDQYFAGTMPFTYSHPAAVLPFLGRSNSRGWRTALVLGSMTPDFARAFPWIDREFSHSLAGLFLLDTPLAAVLAVIASLWIVPRAARLPGLERLARPSLPIGWGLVILGAFLGGGTHLIWDIFTHGDTPIFHAAFLDTPLTDTISGPYRVRHLAWPLHSLAGFLAVAIAVAAHFRKSPWGLAALARAPWIRLALAGTLPLLALLRIHPIHLGSMGADLAMLFHSNHPGLRFVFLGSGALLAAQFLYETRRRRTT